MAEDAELANWQGGPFARLYEQWLSDHDTEIERQMRESYRDAWVTGDDSDRSSVLHFILLTKEEAGADLVVEGLKSEDLNLARGAAAVASCVETYGFDLGPDIRRVFRDLVRRLPTQDVSRWTDLYERDEPDTHPEDSAFLRLYEEWMKDWLAERESTFTTAIENTYRAAWDRGDPVDQAFVLLAVSYLKAEDSVGLVKEGLGSSDPRLAHTAGFLASGLIKDGRDLGPEFAQILDEYEARFPERGSWAWHIRYELAQIAGQA
jgi:hypothetical protein